MQRYHEVIGALLEILIDRIKIIEIFFRIRIFKPKFHKRNKMSLSLKNLKVIKLYYRIDKYERINQFVKNQF